ncbi:MAG: regulatory protein RecX [Bacteroidia bacterium]|jgi:regulatory protein|nr:regulatory protein RecX [Bacteroidia bacterium]
MDTARAKEKILKYCAYQERSQKEVKNKLYEMGLYTDQVNELMLYLIQENYLNEERFAMHFAASKMRQKKWGRRKIEVALKEKGVTEKLIKQSIAALNKIQYSSNLEALIEKKDRTLKYSSEYERKQKLIRYFLGRGYLWTEIEIALEDFLKV